MDDSRQHVFLRFYFDGRLRLRHQKRGVGLETLVSRNSQNQDLESSFPGCRTLRKRLEECGIIINSDDRERGFL